MSIERKHDFFFQDEVVTNIERHMGEAGDYVGQGAVNIRKTKDLAKARRKVIVDLFKI